MTTDDEDLSECAAPEAIAAAEESRKDRAELERGFKRGSLHTVLLMVVVAGVVGTFAMSVISTGASTSASSAAKASVRSSDAARTAASAAESAAADTRGLVQDQRRQNSDATCRAVFNAPVADARVVREDAYADLLIALTSQASLAIAGRERDAGDFREVVLAVKRLNDVGLVVNAANDEYQLLLSSSERDRPTFHAMCARGPTVFRRP